MLTKLLKYEAKTTARVLLPIGGGVLAFTLITGLANAILNSWSELPTAVEWMQALLNVAAVLALIFVSGVCVFVNVQRFYRLLGEQGYLMLSLPVPVWKHIAAKLITACVWTVLGIGYLFLCATILGGSFVSLSFSGDVITPDAVAAFMMLFLLLLVVLAGTYLEFYMACAIGGQFGQQRLLASIVAYFVIGFVEQVLCVFLVIILAVGAIQINAFAWFEMFYQADSFWSVIYIFTVLILGLLIVNAIKWAITQWLMTRRLNLA